MHVNYICRPNHFGAGLNAHLPLFAIYEGKVKSEQPKPLDNLGRRYVKTATEYRPFGLFIAK
jgi:hypothetical protein